MVYIQDLIARYDFNARALNYFDYQIMYRTTKTTFILQ